MGGGAVQTTAAGVHGGIHAAGLEKHIQYNKFHKHTHAQIFGGLPMVVYHMQSKRRDLTYIFKTAATAHA